MTREKYFEIVCNFFLILHDMTILLAENPLKIHKFLSMPGLAQTCPNMPKHAQK